MAKKKTASENAPATKAATKKTPVKEEKGFEESLWDSATRLRGNVESSEYKHVVLSLIFLKFVSDKFEERRAALIAEGKQAYTDMVEFYAMQNVFYLPETSRWSHIQQHAKQGDIAIKIDSALAQVEKSNASLKGALPDNYFIYDPCCCCGGMFVQSLKFVQSHHGNTKDISVYGQEFTATT